MVAPDDHGMQRLLIAGSIALDDRDTNDGRHVTAELGGSALYSSLAASLICPVTMLAPVGADVADLVRDMTRDRDISLEHVSVVDGPTYRWEARVVGGSNVEIASHDAIYDLWSPQMPAMSGGWAFIGSMRPDRQLQLARGLRTCDVLASDSMLSHIRTHPRETFELLGISDWFFCNEEEISALGGSPQRPDDFRSHWGLDVLCLKSGPGGASLLTAGDRLHLPALSRRRVVDTTGAGDALAGGVLGWWRVARDDDRLPLHALACGVACASIAIEDIGVRGLAAATPGRLAARMEEVLKAVTPDHHRPFDG
jgi:sugar/nucleoside kinase (ribokinase family)